MSKTSAANAAPSFRIDRVRSPLGALLVVFDDAGRLRALDFADFEPRLRSLLRSQYRAREVQLAPGRAPQPVRDALAAYFAGDTGALAAIETETGGTPFQRRVWSALRRIPAGTTTSYGALAAKIGRPGASRAVGLANGANPIGIVVPCHRVVGAKGALTGYAGGVERKRWLLDHEKGTVHLAP
jgi:methylated-DNA-[protein]-cysteine S-methyltransferase